MRNIFHPDSSVMQCITKIAYSTYLNLLWFICCIPIVTIGASTTALFSVTLKVINKEEGNLTINFFQSFKQNFIYATKVWLLLLSFGIILCIDGYILYHLKFEHIFWTILTAIFVIMVIGFHIILMYVFPLMASFDNTVFKTIKNSLFLGMKFLLCTVLMTVIYFSMIFIIIRIFTPAIIFGYGLCALLCSYLLSNIMKLLKEQSQTNANK